MHEIVRTIFAHLPDLDSSLKLLMNSGSVPHEVCTRIFIQGFFFVLRSFYIPFSIFWTFAERYCKHGACRRYR
jgi:hypothetical protein